MAASSSTSMPLTFSPTFSATPKTKTTTSLSFNRSTPSSFTVTKPTSFRVLTKTVIYATASEPVTETKKRAPRGFSKPRPVSPEMKEFLGGRTEIPRTEVLKVIWAHIKEHNLQDPANKRVIVCDEKLKKIFGERDTVGFLEIAGLISPHFRKVES
uniref:SWI/SNF and RSC complexes subunit ssr3-like n=1 Tax=Erigeron canadensis TaxID=72917 RepID=UPI001CB9054A|nr:SWI/SNF and RSC complexes subunit ssr3-like [Erigeron canadensis]